MARAKIWIACLAAAFAAGAGTVAFAVQQSAAAPAGKHPDFSGIWTSDSQLPLVYSPMTPEGQRTFERNKKGIAESDPNVDASLTCMPTGFPRSALANSPFVLIQTPEMLAMIGERTSGRMRPIYIGADHMKGLPPQFHGDSVAHWDGDTLVVDVVNVDDRTFYNMGGIPHSKAFHAVEHFRLLDGGKTLQDRVDIDDPIIFTKPWTFTVKYTLRNDMHPVEQVCSNNRLHP